MIVHTSDDELKSHLHSLHEARDAILDVFYSLFALSSLQYLLYLGSKALKVCQVLLFTDEELLSIVVEDSFETFVDKREKQFELLEVYFVVDLHNFIPEPLEVD